MQSELFIPSTTGSARASVPRAPNGIRTLARALILGLLLGWNPDPLYAGTTKDRVEPAPDRYADQDLGFVFAKPRFPLPTAPDSSTVAVTLSAPPVDGFAPNVNVIVHDLATSLDDYQTQQRHELESAGWQVLELAPAKSGGRPSLRTHARGRLNGSEIEFLAVAVKRDPKTLYVLTCTATAAQFPTYQVEFERVAASFVLEP